MTAPAITLEGRAAIAGEVIFGPLALRAPAGQITCLLGPSGVGKSTVLRLLAGLAPYVDFTGHMAADDQAPLPPRSVLMQQADMLLPWLSVLDNITVGARLRGEKPDTARAKTLMEAVGLSGLDQRLPHTLSGGQRQRVALARTLMEDRDVVLLDEPFAALDPRTRAQMQDLAARLFQGKTVVLVTHDTAEAARLAQHLVILTGNAAETIATPHSATPRSPHAPETIAFAGAITAAMMQAKP